MKVLEVGSRSSSISLGTILSAYKDFEDRFALVETKLPALGDCAPGDHGEGRPVYEAGHP